jgi:acyl-CoA-binding protein
MLADGGGDILRHELTHVVTKVAGVGPYGDLPAWLDEGTAMYAQSEPGAGFTNALERAVDKDQLMSVRSMTSPTGDPDKITLFYGEAWSLVSFLVDEYGEEKFARLYAIFKDGSTTDNALQQVYGFDQDGLEDAWRASLGSQAGDDWATVVGVGVAGLILLTATLGGGVILARRLRRR